MPPGKGVREHDDGKKKVFVGDGERRVCWGWEESMISLEEKLM